MEERPKRPRGRPRKYPKDIISDVKHGHEYLTDRGAQNSLNYGHALVEICDHCTLETQLYFLGGITRAELHAGARPKRKMKRYVMAEIGRHPQEEIVEIAEEIANNRTFDTWTQQQMVDLLKDIRLGRRQA
jgi:hypothetical protein